jgi:hypothetical protein
MEELGCAGASTARIRGRRRSSAAQKQNPAEPAGAAQKQSRSTTLCIAPVERIVSDFRSAVLCACWAVGGQPAAAVCTVHSLSDCCCCALQERAQWRPRCGAVAAAGCCCMHMGMGLLAGSSLPPAAARPQQAPGSQQRTPGGSYCTVPDRPHTAHSSARSITVISMGGVRFAAC